MIFSFLVGCQMFIVRTKVVNLVANTAQIYNDLMDLPQRWRMHSFFEVLTTNESVHM